MAYWRGDCASAGPHEVRFNGKWFPRSDINPVGTWVNVDCNDDGSVFAATSAGERYELGPPPRPDNPIAVRWLPARSVFKVAWIDGALVGHSIDLDGSGFRIPGSDSTFDGTGAGSQGIRDMDEHGTIYFKDATDLINVDGLPLLHWRERGLYIVGVLANAWLGISVYVKPTRLKDSQNSGAWYRAFPYDVQLMPGIAANGTVAAVGEGGGFIEMADWLTRPFDPHAEPHTDAPHSDAPPHTDAPHTDSPPHIDAPPHTDAPHTDAPQPPEPDMNHAAVLVGKVWYHVEEVVHPDNPEHGPVVGVQRVSDGYMLKVRQDGKVEFEEGTPGADERLIPTPGTYVALRDETHVIEKAGPWSA